MSPQTGLTDSNRELRFGRSRGDLRPGPALKDNIGRFTRRTILANWGMHIFGVGEVKIRVGSALSIGEPD
jgi:hypothetical protein